MIYKNRVMSITKNWISALPQNCADKRLTMAKHIIHCTDHTRFLSIVFCDDTAFLFLSHTSYNLKFALYYVACDLLAH
jgi:hypothetical protein